MSQLYGVDVSEFQGTINWDELNAVSNFVIIRASFGTERTDNQFARNQSEARRVQKSAGPLGIGYYYFAYPELLDPVTSANYFIDNLGALQAGEILALDLEGNIGTDPVGWSLGFLNQCEARTGVKPVIYINQSILNGYNWQPVIDGGFGLWIADYDGSKTAVPPSGKWPVVALKQWTDADTVSGISGKVDGDTFFGDFDQWNAYGYKPTPTPPPPEPSTTTTTTATTTQTTTTTTTAPEPAPAPSSSTSTTLPPSPVPPGPPGPLPPPKPTSLWERILNWFKGLFK